MTVTFSVVIIETLSKIPHSCCIIILCKRSILNYHLSGTAGAQIIAALMLKEPFTHYTVISGAMILGERVAASLHISASRSSASVPDEIQSAGRVAFGRKQGGGFGVMLHTVQK